MQTVFFVIEYAGKITLNNEYATDVTESKPLMVEWFPNNDFIIETHEKIFINTANIEYITSARVIKIEPNVYIIRPRKIPTGDTAPKENQIAADRVEYTSSEIIAIKELGTLMGHVRITKFSASAGKINVEETYIATASEKTKVQPYNLPLAFLQCVQLRDYKNARLLLSFEISDKHLSTYFGEDFEIISNNRLNPRNTVSIVPHQKIGFTIARNIKFETDGEKITNVN